MMAAMPRLPLGAVPPGFLAGDQRARAADKVLFDFA